MVIICYLPFYLEVMHPLMKLLAFFQYKTKRQDKIKEIFIFYLHIFL